MQKERGVSVWSYSAISGVIAFKPMYKYVYMI